MGCSLVVSLISKGLKSVVLPSRQMMTKCCKHPTQVKFFSKNKQRHYQPLSHQAYALHIHCAEKWHGKFSSDVSGVLRHR